MRSPPDPLTTSASRTIPNKDINSNQILAKVLWAEPGGLQGLRRVLAPLERHDSLHRTQFVKTLEAFVAGDMTIRATARALGVHRHTAETRLRKTEQILGLKLRCGTDRVVVELAICALRLKAR